MRTVSAGSELCAKSVKVLGFRKRASELPPINHVSPSRFGLWDSTLDLKHFANFIAYAAEVNSFLPRAVIPYVAVLATVCETLLGILLILGL